MCDWHRDVATGSIDLADAIMMDSFLNFIYPHMKLWLSECAHTRLGANQEMIVQGEAAKNR